MLRRTTAHLSLKRCAGRASVRFSRRPQCSPLCSSTKNEGSNFDRFKLLLASRGSVILGGTVLTLGVSKVVIGISGFFTSITHQDVGYAGFVAGFLSAGVSGVIAFVLYRVSYIRPERVFRESLRIVSNSSTVRQKMGVGHFGSLRGGDLRAYRMKGGGIGLSRTKALEWQSPRVSMMYQVYGGDSAQAVVCVEALKKTNGSLKFEYLSVDMVTDVDAPTLWIEGEGRNDVEAASLQDLVGLRKRYV